MSISRYGNSNRPRGAAGDIITFLLFLVLAGYCSIELFFPVLLPARARDIALRQAALPPDPELLQTLVLDTPAIPIDPRWRPKRLSSRWRWIVVHHTGTIAGAPDVIDRYHRNVKHMENGLAYHFLIGNGRGMRDGEIFIGRRWREQLDGGHIDGGKFDHISVGVSLVGNFENEVPTAAQIASLKGLLNYLIKELRISPARIRGHGSMQGEDTLCPGKLFPVDLIVRARKQLAQ